MATLTAEPLTRETQTAPKLKPEPAAETWQPTRRPFTADEYQRMIETGILDEDERVELLDGEIFVMAPPGPEHQASVGIGTTLFAPLAVRRAAIVWVQNSVRLGEHSRPEPDLALLKWRDDHYRHRLPEPQDVLLIIETSDSTLSHDQGPKLARYAESAIPEVWIENIPDRQIEAHRNPVNGEYAETRIYRPGETLSPQAFPDLELSVSQLVGVAPSEPNKG